MNSASRWLSGGSGRYMVLGIIVPSGEHSTFLRETRSCTSGDLVVADVEPRQMWWAMIEVVGRHRSLRLNVAHNGERRFVFNIGLTGIDHHLVLVETDQPYSLATESSVADGIAQQLIDEQQHGVAENPPSTDMFPMLDDGEPGTAEWFLEQLSGEPDPRTVFIATARDWRGLTQAHQDAFVRAARGEGAGIGMIVILNDAESVPVIEHAVRAVEVDYA